MLELLSLIQADPALPFASSISGYIILIVLGLNTLLLFVLVFMCTALLLRPHETGSRIKRAIRKAVDEALAEERAK